MIAPCTPFDEAERLDALESLSLLDTPPEDRFDRITRLATRLFDVPIALVSLVDVNRQWFKSRQGLDAPETPRDVSFCGHAILGPEMLVVPDATLDPRFADNPLVVGAPHIRFYAGFPIRTPNGQPVGTLCLLDRRPRTFGAAERASLEDLGRTVEREFASHELANTDALTGILNRRGFEAAAQPMLSAIGRLGVPATLIFIDLDHFKQINDLHGHAEGDRTLREMAAILVDQFRACDVVARIGGDEFVVLLSGTDESKVQEPLSRLAAAVATRNSTCTATISLEYSTGIVTVDHDTTTTDVLAEADRRMYRQKRRTGIDTTNRELAQVLLELAKSLTDSAPLNDRLDRLCRHAVELLGCDRSSIFLADGDHFRGAHNFGNPTDIAEHFEKFRVPKDDRLISAAFRSRTCVAVNDVATSEIMNQRTASEARIRSIAVAPMAVGDEALGFMTAEYNERNGVFSELDATLLHGISQVVAGVIQSAEPRN